MKIFPLRPVSNLDKAKTLINLMENNLNLSKSSSKLSAKIETSKASEIIAIKKFVNDLKTCLIRGRK